MEQWEYYLLLFSFDQHNRTPKRQYRYSGNGLNHGFNGLKDFTDNNLCHLLNQNKSVILNLLYQYSR